MSVLSKSNSERIRELNDSFRQTFTGGMPLSSFYGMGTNQFNCIANNNTSGYHLATRRWGWIGLEAAFLYARIESPTGLMQARQPMLHALVEGSL